MTTIEHPVETTAAPAYGRKGSVLADWLSSTDHKVIGHLYLITSFFFFMVAGLMALIMRAQLLGPSRVEGVVGRGRPDDQRQPAGERAEHRAGASR